VTSTIPRTLLCCAEIRCRTYRLVPLRRRRGVSWICRYREAGGNRQPLRECGCWVAPSARPADRPNRARDRSGVVGATSSGRFWRVRQVTNSPTLARPPASAFAADEPGWVLLGCFLTRHASTYGCESDDRLPQIVVAWTKEHRLPDTNPSLQSSADVGRAWTVINVRSE
jgi:hypothetical protein